MEGGIASKPPASMGGHGMAAGDELTLHNIFHSSLLLNQILAAAETAHAGTQGPVCSLGGGANLHVLWAQSSNTRTIFNEDGGVGDCPGAVPPTTGKMHAPCNTRCASAACSLQPAQPAACSQPAASGACAEHAADDAGDSA